MKVEGTPIYYFRGKDGETYKVEMLTNSRSDRMEVLASIRKIGKAVAIKPEQFAVTNPMYLTLTNNEKTKNLAVATCKNIL